MLMEAFTGYLMAAVLAVSLLFAPAARAQDAQIRCSIGTMAPFMAPRHNCEMLTIQADAMREVLKNAPPDLPVIPIITSCIRGLNANLPGYDYNTYFNTCSQILQSMAVVH
jgi:hypothetical protein